MLCWKVSRYSAWLDPATGQELKFGTPTEIMVAPEKGYEDDFESYREFVMLLNDFQELFDKDGNPIMMQAPQFPDGFPDGRTDLNVGAHPQGSFHDHGVQSINYRTEPLWERMKTALADPNPPRVKQIHPIYSILDYMAIHQLIYSKHMQMIQSR